MRHKFIVIRCAVSLRLRLFYSVRTRALRSLGSRVAVGLYVFIYLRYCCRLAAAVRGRTRRRPAKPNLPPARATHGESRILRHPPHTAKCVYVTIPRVHSYTQRARKHIIYTSAQAIPPNSSQQHKHHGEAEKNLRSGPARITANESVVRHSIRTFPMLIYRAYNTIWPRGKTQTIPQH